MSIPDSARWLELGELYINVSDSIADFEGEGQHVNSHDDGYCGRREDKSHCEHWWDGGRCCTCGWDKPS